ncbi:hypothetical protein [Streptomyces sp. NPDC055749]
MAAIREPGSSCPTAATRSRNSPADAAEQARYNTANGINPAITAANDMVNAAYVPDAVDQGAPGAAQAMSTVAVPLGTAACVSAFIPGLQPLAAGLGVLSLVFARASTLYNAKAYGRDSDEVLSGVAGTAAPGSGWAV